MRQEIGEIMMELNDSYTKLIDSNDIEGALGSLISGFNRLENKYGNDVKIDFGQLDLRIKNAYKEEPESSLAKTIDRLIEKGIIIDVED